ncbi:MAG: sortase [Lachnospiraceae bacterium]|nr:sortase [Lachnospiraceae bacterium]
MGYNLYESYRAGKAADAIMDELEEMIESGVEDASEDGQSEGDTADAEGNTEDGGSSHKSGNTSPAGENSEEANLGELYPDRDMPSVMIDGTAYAGWIFIPSLSMRLPVQSEWNYGMLDISPAIYSGSVYQNNMIIGGHSYITHFRALRGIAPGARVNFYDAEGFAYEYEVEYVMSLNPNQGLILSDEEKEDWDLTLFTCNTGGQTRCVVRCVRV